MGPALPSSLSPHVCLLPSSDLVQLLENASLPPLHDILQSFSPLPQVTTRTTTLTTVSHPSFALRFSDLADTERACLEDDEKRAARTIDWIGERIAKNSTRWLKELDDHPDRYSTRTPWWDELSRCAEGDHSPSKYDAWNHPLSIILAVSTTAPNPLQAITALHSRMLEFPPWVDTAHLLYTLIVHPKGSPLSDEEAGALFNAVKKQYGLHAFILHLTLPSPPPPPVPVPALLPRLPLPFPEIWKNGPPTPTPDSVTSLVVSPRFLKLSELDIQEMARFTREFVVMSLIPWMEKCVLEWNEAYSSSRRLPSRIFSSTRKLFGSNPAPAQNPVHTSSFSITSLPSRSHMINPTSASTVLSAPPSRLRRLAELATILGDYKLATNVWESLRKENKDVSDILPLLLSPSPAVVMHASYAISAIYPLGSDLSPQAQVQALKCAVRWEAGIHDFTSDTLEGERWLVWAAGNAEEPPSALLLAHAAFLSARKSAKRRAALWYLFAANRLEKCGIKPLTMFFLRKAHDLFCNQPKKSLSPSFWNSEGQSSSGLIGFDAVLSGIEQPLGRLLYTTGDIEGAVKFFLEQLRWSSASSPFPKTNRENEEESKEANSDSVLLEDFRVAFLHLKSVSAQGADFHDLKLPITFVSPAFCRARLPRDSTSGDQTEWERREDLWTMFWRTRGKETLEKSGRAAVGEPFWVDVALQNPLDAEVTFLDLTLAVEAKDRDASWIQEYVSVERVNEVILTAKEHRIVSIEVKALQAASLVISSITYNFLGLFPTSESLARRGRRLQDTLQQRQTIAYAPEILIRTEVEEASQELAVSFENNDLLVLCEGECKSMGVWMTNVGCKTVGEVWLVGGPEDQMWLGSSESETLLVEAGSTETLRIDNKLSSWSPHAVPINKELHSGDSTLVTLKWRPDHAGLQQLCLLFIYRETGGRTFHCTRVTRTFQVNSSLELSATCIPNPSIDSPFLINLEVSNLSSKAIWVRQVTAVSPAWKCHHLTPLSSTPLQPGQITSISFNTFPLDPSTYIDATTAFVSRTLGDILNGRKIEAGDPPPLDLSCRHVSASGSCISIQDPVVYCLFLSEKKKIVAHSIVRSHPHIPAVTHPQIFTLFNPSSVDFMIFWEIPSEKRAGFVLLPSFNLGAGHAALQEVIEDVGSAKVKRSMYAETQREKMEILQSIHDSEWNTEMNPLVVTIHEDVVEHDFSQGFCLVPVKLTLRNHSLTHPSRYVIKFTAEREGQSESSDLLPPRYVGRLTIRGVLHPSQSTTVDTRLWVSRPGAYALSGWQVETTVGEPGSGHEQSSWRTRHRYVQGPPKDLHPRIVITDVSR